MSADKDKNPPPPRKPRKGHATKSKKPPPPPKKPRTGLLTRGLEPPRDVAAQGALQAWTRLTRKVQT